jgi:5'-nucleotidase
MFGVIRMRITAATLALFVGTAAIGAQTTVDVKILAINDLHGQITTGQKVSGRPVGGAAVLAAYLDSAAGGWENRCALVNVGDLIGASQPECALLQDEPAIMLMNSLSARMPVIGAIGNHELDEGIPELTRLLKCGNHANGPFLQNPWKGATFPVICGTMTDSVTTFPIFAPFNIKWVPGINVPIAFIGAALKETPTMVSATSVAGLKFIDEAKTVNYYVSMLRDNFGIHAFVVLLHQGGSQTSYSGWTDTLKAGPSSEIVNLVSQFDDDVDVVCTAHSHAFTNALVKNAHGRRMLLTQAYSKGTAYAEIVCTVDKASCDITAKKARIVTTYGDAGAGLTPDPVIAAGVDTCVQKVQPLTSRVIGSTNTAIVKAQNGAGESPLGDLIAEAQRVAMTADFCMMNPGGIRADLPAGDITWGALYAAQPFNNYLVKMTLTGQQIYDVLNQQWAGQPYVKMLEIAGFSYTWDNSLAVGNRIVEVRRNGTAIDRNVSFPVVVNNFLAGGGDNFTVLRNGLNPVTGPIDLDALVAFIQAHPQPINYSTIQGRVERLN